MSNLAEQIKKIFPDIKQNINLSNLSYFNIGGPAEFYLETGNRDLLAQALTVGDYFKLPIFILGGGTNILINDDGVKGLVIKVTLDEIKISEENVKAEAGVNFSRLVDKSLKSNLIGLEFAAGLPGTVGGAVRGNAGSFGGQVSDYITQVTILKRNESKNWKEVCLDNKQCRFGYRTSIFKESPGYVIVETEFKLQRGDLMAASAQAKKNLSYRMEKTDYRQKCAGSFFMNIKGRDFNDFVIKNPKLELPPEALTRQALAAGWLIEQVGLKGYKLGGAKVSDKHANFLINSGGATASDVIKLANLIKDEVRNKFQCELREEVELVGF